MHCAPFFPPKIQETASIERWRRVADKHQHVIRHPIICTFLASWKTNMEESSNGSDNGGLEEIVRRCVREELVNSRGGCNNQNLVNRTRNLIRSSASFTARQHRVKFPLISEDDFDFVKRERNSIVTPVVKENHVKHLCGAGKLYVRLNVSKDVISKDMAGATSDDSDSSIPAMLPSTNDRVVRPSTSTPTVIVNDETRKKQVTHSNTNPAVCSTLRMRTAISPWQWQPWRAVSSLLGLISMA